MTIKVDKTLENELDVRWRRKGHSHIVDRYEPIVCPACCGYGKISNKELELHEYPCDHCGGTGEI